MKVSLFTKIFADRPLEEAIDRAADLGYDGVEIMARAPHFPADTSIEDAQALRDRLDEHGLSVPCLATYTGDYVGKSSEENEAELAKLERFLELADVIGTDLIRHGPNGPPPYRATDDDFEEAAQWMQQAADLASEYGVTLGVEIHASKLTETTDSTLRLLDAIDRDNVGAIHDAGNMYITGDDYGPSSVERLGSDLAHVHVKDEQRVDDETLPGAFTLETKAGGETFQPHLLGEGSVDHRPLVQALARAGYEGHLTAECHVPQPEPDDDSRVAEHELSTLRELVDSVE